MLCENHHEILISRDRDVIFLCAFSIPCYVEEVGQYVSESWRHLESYESIYKCIFHCIRSQIALVITIDFTATRPSKSKLSRQ